MKTSKPKVAIVGLGNIGKVVAANLVQGNRDVILASRKIDEAKALAQELGSRARASEIGAAVQEADIVVLAIWFDAIRAFVQQYASELQGKVIIDPSNPIAPDGNNGFKKIIGAQESAGQIIKAITSKGRPFVLSGH